MQDIEIKQQFITGIMVMLVILGVIAWGVIILQYVTGSPASFFTLLFTTPYEVPHGSRTT